MTSSIRSAINPLVQRAAIDALEAQRAAYQRFARMVEQQQAVLSDGDGDRAAAFADEAVAGFQALEHGARELAPLLAEARAVETPADAQAMRRRLDELTRDAQRAELSIRNLSLQLEAWRDAYGRQLGELGITPGAAPGSTGGQADAGDAGRGPGRPGRGYGASGSIPSLIDRRG